MANKATYRYPTKYDKNIPSVLFQSYNYTTPSSKESFNGTAKAEKKPNSIPDISLYMPGDFSENINATWGLESIYQGTNSWGAALVSNITERFSGADGGKIINSAKAVGGVAPLPTDILIFQNVDPMSVTFNFKLVPYDQDEGNTIVKIAKTFKKNIMPSLINDDNSTGILLKFPPLWDIKFIGINGIGISNDIEGYEFMALTNCSVSYTSEQESAAIYHDKNPVQINLSLSFQHIKKHWILNEE
jgi:hypothetical protein